jgi:hypothetical protein
MSSNYYGSPIRDGSPRPMRAVFQSAANFLFFVPPIVASHAMMVIWLVNARKSDLNS